MLAASLIVKSSKVKSQTSGRSARPTGRAGIKLELIVGLKHNCKSDLIYFLVMF